MNVNVCSAVLLALHHMYAVRSMGNGGGGGSDVLRVFVCAFLVYFGFCFFYSTFAFRLHFFMRCLVFFGSLDVQSVCAIVADNTLIRLIVEKNMPHTHTNTSNT